MSFAYCLLQKKNINAFRIPNVTTTKGHYFASWKDKIWRGNIKIMAEDLKIWVELINYDNTLYAKAVIPERIQDGVQKVMDSSRGYALRLTSDDGRTMWIGLGFHDRNDAFDFNETFKEFAKQRDQELNPQKYAMSDVDMTAFALKPGQKLVIGGGGDASDGFGGNSFADPFQPSNPGTGGGSDFSSFKIDGPDENSNTATADMWGGFGDSSNANSQAPKFNLLDDNFFGGGQSQPQAKPESDLLANPFASGSNNQPANNANNNFSSGFGTQAPPANQGGNPFGQEVDLLGL